MTGKIINENKSSLPNDNLNQDNSDLDDEIPFKKKEKFMRN